MGAEHGSLVQEGVRGYKRPQLRTMGCLLLPPGPSGPFVDGPQPPDHLRGPSQLHRLKFKRPPEPFPHHISAGQQSVTRRRMRQEG